MGVGRRNQGLLVKVRNWPRGRSCGLDVLAYGAFARQSGTTRPVYEELAHLLRQLRLKAWLEDQGQTTGEAELQGQEMLGRLQPSSGVGRRRGQERWDDDDPSLPEPARYLAALSAGRGAFPIFGGVRWPEGGLPCCRQRLRRRWQRLGPWLWQVLVVAHNLTVIATTQFAPERLLTARTGAGRSVALLGGSAGMAAARAGCGAGQPVKSASRQRLREAIASRDSLAE